jgi:hypothetical protein
MFGNHDTRPILAAALALALAMLPRFALAEAKLPAGSDICRTAIRDSESRFDIPFGIMQAISLAESGRWHKETRSKFAWPWTVTARGKGEFYDSRDEAIAAVKRLKREGVRNIDVGCMQVNLMHHPDAFSSLEEAFDPDANARYASALFVKLRESNRSIMRAIAHYHSTTRQFNQPYTQKVIVLWNEERRRFYEDERQRKIEEWRRARAARQGDRVAQR